MVREKENFNKLSPVLLRGILDRRCVWWHIDARPSTGRIPYGWWSSKELNDLECTPALGHFWASTFVTDKIIPKISGLTSGCIPSSSITGLYKLLVVLRTVSLTGGNLSLLVGVDAVGDGNALTQSLPNYRNTINLMPETRSWSYSFSSLLTLHQYLYHITQTHQTSFHYNSFHLDLLCIIPRQSGKGRARFVVGKSAGRGLDYLVDKCRSLSLSEVNRSKISLIRTKTVYISTPYTTNVGILEKKTEEEKEITHGKNRVSRPLQLKSVNRFFNMSKGNGKSLEDSIGPLAPAGRQDFSCAKSATQSRAEAGSSSASSPAQPQDSTIHKSQRKMSADEDPLGDPNESGPKCDYTNSDPLKEDSRDEASKTLVDVIRNPSRDQALDDPETSTPLQSSTPRRHDHPSRDQALDDPETSTPIQSSTPRHQDHQCSHQKDSRKNVSESRHEGFGNDTCPSEELEDPAAPPDTENEYDSEGLRKKASGVSNITGDLDQLHPDNTDQEMKESSPEADATRAPPPVKLPEDVIEENTPDNILDTDVKLSEDHIQSVNENKEGQESAEKMNETECDDGGPRRRGRPLSDTSSFSSPPSTPDERGKAGLDTDYSSEWVPYVIDPEKNLSKSKKRRRRQKRIQERALKKDSLGKLLSGQQTRDDEEMISTYDHGNKIRECGQDQDLDDSSISGSISQGKHCYIEDPEDESFEASANSTRHGQDFDSHSILRDNTGDDQLVNEDIEDMDVIPEGDREIEDNLKATPPNAGDKKTTPNDSHSSNSTGGKKNSTGGKKKRRRQKKNADKKKQDAPDGHTLTNRETRSKTLAQNTLGTGTSGQVVQDQHPVKPNRKQDEDQHRGEKEKGSDKPQTGTLQVMGDKRVDTFKRPAVRSDIQKLVSKAVFKSRARTSNAFTFNSKIQNFKITTNSADITKIPDIDDSAPLIELTIPEFIWPQEDVTLNNVVNVKSRGVIQFVILVKSAHTENALWDTPAIDRVRNFASYLMCQIAELKLDFGNVLRWTNTWGNIAVMGLDSSDLDMLLRFRTFFSTLRYFHQFFNTFPKDALTNNHGLTVLLRSELREFKEEFLAEALFARNKLYGIVDTLQTETYTAADTTRAGVSKNGWRNVLLEGNPEFLESLSTFTENHWFNIGPATVQIHGGDRRAETAEEIEAKSRKKRFNMPSGQNLTSSAKEAIDQSFREDQRARILAKNPIARTHSQSYASKAGTNKKKK